MAYSQDAMLQTLQEQRRQLEHDMDRMEKAMSEVSKGGGYLIPDYVYTDQPYPVAVIPRSPAHQIEDEYQRAREKHQALRNMEAQEKLKQQYKAAQAREKMMVLSESMKYQAEMMKPRYTVAQLQQRYFEGQITVEELEEELPAAITRDGTRIEDWLEEEHQVALNRADHDDGLATKPESRLLTKALSYAVPAAGLAIVIVTIFTVVSPMMLILGAALMGIHAGAALERRQPTGGIGPLGGL